MRRALLTAICELGLDGAGRAFLQQIAGGVLPDHPLHRRDGCFHGVLNQRDVFRRLGPVVSSFHLAQAGVLQLVAKKKTGRVVFIGSCAGHTPHAPIPTYCIADYSSLPATTFW